MKNVSVILPSLDPDEKILKLIKELIDASFNDIIIINDGSATKNLSFFEKAAEYEQCTVLTHSENLGKGAALKTGFSYVLENRKNSHGVITIDGDGQHRVEDIVNCVNEFSKQKDTVVLGTRDFNAKDVPPRSRFGNKLTSFMFRFVFGLSLKDTQTGLRALPFNILEKLCKVQGMRFEYETNMLLFFKSERVLIKQVDISTVYLDDNKTSHFNPIFDSLRVYSVIIKYFVSSISASVLDIGIFTLLNLALDAFLPRIVRLLSATIIARILSAFYNFAVNHKVVFKSEAPAKQTITRYAVLCILQMLASYALVFLISQAFSTFVGFDSIIKVVVDTVLFFISFRIQQAWVFANKQKPKR